MQKFTDLIFRAFSPPVSPGDKSQEKRLLEALELTRYNHSICTVRGEVSRYNAAIIYAAYYEISIPNAEPSADEEAWISELRDYLPKGAMRRISPLFFTAYIEGHLAYFRGETTPPEDYSLLGPTKSGGGSKLRAEGLAALYKFWDAGHKRAATK